MGKKLYLCKNKYNKMERILFIILCGLLVLPAWSRQRSVKEADAIARSVIQNSKNAKSKSLKGIQNLKIVKSSDILERPDVTASHEVFFAFKPESESGGYVLVSADDCMPAVLAVSDNGEFDENNIPENMKVMLLDYADALATIESGKATARSIFYPKTTEENEVEPLLGDIMYNQGSPYNAQCPMRPSTNTRPATGCVATAMAQVMRYHRWPQDYGKGSVSYTSKTEKDTVDVSYDFSKVKFDWAAMMDGYKGTKGTDYTGNDTQTTADSMKFYACSGIRYNSGSNIAVDSLIVINDKDFTGYIQLMLADDKGNLLQPIGSSKNYFNKSKGSLVQMVTFAFSMPGTYEDGNYRFYVATKEKGAEAWSYVNKAPDWEKWSDKSTHVPAYVPVVKKGDKYYIDGKEFACVYTQKAMDAVAELMAACGASVKMQYGSSSSASTSTIASAGYNYFGYDHNALYISSSYMTTDDWHRYLQRDLLEARPVIYRGTNDSGGGHAFVLDGFRYTNDVPYYHVNWGWGGSSNGYFLLTLLKPSEAGTGGSVSNYSHSNGMILNFKKDDGKEEYSLGVRGMSVDTTYVLPGGKITATVPASMINLGVAAYTGTMNICLKSSTGKIYDMGTCYNASDLKQNYYYTSSKSVTYTVPTTMPLGDYTLTMFGVPSDGNRCDVYNAYEITIHVVPEDPSTAMEGVLRYTFDEATKTAKVRRFSTSTSYNAQRYVGDIVVPDSVTYQGVRYEVTAIGDSAFFGCTDLNSLIMSDHVKSVGKHVFNGCTALTKVQYPVNFKGAVDAYTFYKCMALKSLTLPDSITSIATYAFATNGLKSLVVPKGVATIATKAFYENDSIKEITLPEGLTTVNISAFRGCTALEKVNIPSTYAKILNYTFYGCSSLKELVVPETVTNISAYAFKDCTAMTAIHVKGTNPATLGSKAFDNTNECPIYVPSGTVEAYKTAWSAYADRIQADSPVGVNSVKVNGDKNDAIYTLDGVKVTNPQKGTVYIVNGKKIILK